MGITMSVSQISLPDVYIISLVHRQQIIRKLCAKWVHIEADSPYSCNLLVSVYSVQEGI